MNISYQILSSLILYMSSYRPVFCNTSYHKTETIIKYELIIMFTDVYK